MHANGDKGQKEREWAGREAEQEEKCEGGDGKGRDRSGSRPKSRALAQSCGGEKSVSSDSDDCENEEYRDDPILAPESPEARSDDGRRQPRGGGLGGSAWNGESRVGRSRVEVDGKEGSSGSGMRG